MLHWTHHAQGKMGFYRLSRQRVRNVLHSPKRIEEGIAPKTIAMMQPTSLKAAGARPGSRDVGSATPKERWTQEIWVMVEDKGKERRVISAWRYPGVTKPRDNVSQGFFRKEYEEYLKNIL